MTRLIVALLVLLTALPAAAQEGERSLLCHARVAHKPLDNVAHVPKESEQGEIVVMPPVIQIPLTADLAVWLGLGTPEGTRMESVIGFVEVAKDGTVTYNGKVITDAVTQACAERASSISVDTDRKGGSDLSVSSDDAEAGDEEEVAPATTSAPPAASVDLVPPQTDAPPPRR
jgi:hypothetical protein